MQNRHARTRPGSAWTPVETSGHYNCGVLRDFAALLCRQRGREYNVGDATNSWVFRMYGRDVFANRSFDFFTKSDKLGAILVVVFKVVANGRHIDKCEHHAAIRYIDNNDAYVRDVDRDVKT